MRRVVDIALRAAGADSDGARGGVDAHAFHHRHVDHQPVVDAAKARTVMAATANGHGEVVLFCEFDGRDDVGDVGAARDHLGILVDHPVVQAPHGIIVAITPRDDRTAHIADESFGSHGLHDFLLFLTMIGWFFERPFGTSLALSRRYDCQEPERNGFTRGTGSAVGRRTAASVDTQKTPETAPIIGARQGRFPAQKTKNTSKARVVLPEIGGQHRENGLNKTGT
jgi:hypothetical protein